jgi:hypothetical protein
LEGTIAVLREQLAKAEVRADEALVDIRLERAGAREERQRLPRPADAARCRARAGPGGIGSGKGIAGPLAWLLPWRS